MSYILDALKKSEKERKRGKVPDVLTVQEQLSYARKKKTVWPYLIALALLVNAGILLWWTGVVPKRQMKTSENMVTVREAATGEGSSPEKSLSSFRKDAKTIEAEGTSARETPEGKQSVPLPSKDRLPQEKRTQKAVLHTEAMHAEQGSDSDTQTDSTKKPQTSDANLPSEALPPSEPNKIYTYRELPEGIRKNLPPLSLSIALYSDDPATRIARIDGQTLREGQEIKPGLKLDRIVEHGAILSYRNYRFRIGMK